MAMNALVTVFVFLSQFGLNTSLYRKHHYVDKLMTWSDARRYCNSYYDDLSTPINEDLKPLSDDPQVTSDYYLIGLQKDTQNPSVMRWITGEEMNNNLWDGKEPNSADEKCGAVKKSSAKVHDVGCNFAKPFYCMEVFELILVQQESTWEEALEYCRSKYIDLAILSSDVIMGEAKDKSAAAPTDDLWMGLRFLAGHWFWVNGEGLGYKVWSSDGEPQCPVANQRCGVYDVNKEIWQPADCEKRLNFLCVKKAFN